MQARTQSPARGGAPPDTRTLGEDHQRRRQDGDGTNPPWNESLPSEQDRKATLGCLAAVLNVMYSYEHRMEEEERKQSQKQRGGSSDAQRGEGGGASQPSFALREEDGVDDPSKSTSSPSLRRLLSSKSLRGPPNVRTRREDFQRELLQMSAELLFLPPEHAAVFVPNLGIQCASDEQEEQLLLEPFLQSISCEGEAFRCLALLLFRFLLLSSGDGDSNSNGTNDSGAAADNTENTGGGADGDTDILKKTIVGYDARVRVALKLLAVSVLSYWERRPQQQQKQQSMTEDQQEEDGEERSSVLLASDALMRQSTRARARARATRKFEALEDGIAERLSMISAYIQEQRQKSNNDKSLTGQQQRRSLGRSLVRGLKIGTAGVAAGTLFAITGGLAAPAIAAGIATVTGAGLVSTAAITLLTFPAATTIFGLGGGTLVAGKMSNRTKGLGEFEINREEGGTPPDRGGKGDGRGGSQSSSSAAATSPELSRTVCIGGWLTDEHDFQRPFGVTPDTLTDRHELLCRFCSVYAPTVVPKCRGILKEWKGKEDELWDMLRASYGKDPDSLLPMSGPRQDAALSKGEDEAVDGLIRTLGLPVPASHGGASDPTSPKRVSSTRLPPPVNLLADVLTTSTDDDDNAAAVAASAMSAATIRSYKAWDFRAHYGGEQYTVRWEKDLLLQLNGSAKEFTADMAKTAAGEVLKKTAMASVMAAVALPATLLSLSNIIDEKWTLVAERADEAGIVLARSLLDSDAGHRPVSLVGFSFGARIIVSCLRELARHQVIWEEQQQMNGTAVSKQGARKGSTVYTREPASIVEDAILMGCPASVTPSSWSACRRVVAGRLVNCYSKNDLMLTLMYRVKNMRSILSPPAGIVGANISGVENYDVSALVASHGEYCVAVREVLDMIGHDQPKAASSADCAPRGIGE